MTAGRRLEVPSPQFTPNRYGLLSVAQMPAEGDVHWRDGVLTIPDSCGAAVAYADPCPTPEDRTKAIPSGTPIAGADPFTIYAGWECSPVGFSQEEIDRRSRAALLNGEERAVEAVFWSGITENGQDVRPRLAEDADGSGDGFSYTAAEEVASGTATTPTLALAALEAAIGACYGGQPTIHMTRDVATALFIDGGLVRTSAGLETGLGSRVVAGSGYPGTGPGGSAASGDPWMYATGAVAVYRSEIETVGDFPSSVNRTDNTITRLVERTYAVLWDCCLFAARVDLTP